jgi:hypothetical protein
MGPRVLSGDFAQRIGASQPARGDPELSAVMLEFIEGHEQTAGLRRQALSKNFVTFKQFDGQPLASLFSQRIEFDNKIEGANVINEYESARISTLPDETDEIQLLALAFPTLENDNDWDHTVASRGHLAILNIVYRQTWNLVASNSLVPNCSPRVLLNDALTSKPNPHVKFVVANVPLNGKGHPLPPFDTPAASGVIAPPR